MCESKGQIVRICACNCACARALPCACACAVRALPFAHSSAPRKQHAQATMHSVHRSAARQQPHAHAASSRALILRRRPCVVVAVKPTKAEEFRALTDAEITTRIADLKAELASVRLLQEADRQARKMQASDSGSSCQANSATVDSPQCTAYNANCAICVIAASDSGTPANSVLSAQLCTTGCAIQQYTHTRTMHVHYTCHHQCLVTMPGCV